MEYPKKINKKALFLVSIFWIISIVLIFKLGFELTRKILSFLSIIIGLPAGIYGLTKLLSIIDVVKLINKTLINAGENDQKEEEKMKKQMRQ